MGRYDPVIWVFLGFFQNSLVLIPNRKCLDGGSRIRCGDSGTPSTVIYTQWSIWHEELECHTPMVRIFNVNVVTLTNKRQEANS